MISARFSLSTTYRDGYSDKDSEDYKIFVRQFQAVVSRDVIQFFITKEMFYLTTHSKHFIYGYMASDVKDHSDRTRWCHMSYSFQLTAKVLLYAPSHRQDNTYGYMASDIWLRTIQIAREETRCRHMGYSFRLTARVLLYAPSHRQDSTYHSLCYTSRGALAGTRNSSMGPHHVFIRKTYGIIYSY